MRQSAGTQVHSVHKEKLHSVSRSTCHPISCSRLLHQTPHSSSQPAGQDGAAIPVINQRWTSYHPSRLQIRRSRPTTAEHQGQKCKTEINKTEMFLLSFDSEAFAFCRFTSLMRQDYSATTTCRRSTTQEVSHRSHSVKKDSKKEAHEHRSTSFRATAQWK